MKKIYLTELCSFGDDVAPAPLTMSVWHREGVNNADLR